MDERIGFGLDVVGLIAGTHDWSVTLSESEDDGAQFEVTGVEIVEQDIGE